MAFFTNLKLSAFRNFSGTRVDFHPSFNLLYGKNGSGKTNLLEALYLLSFGKSQRGAISKDFIPFGMDHFEVSAGFTAQDYPREIRAVGTEKGHAFFVDHKRLKSAAELIRNVMTVSFAPGDLSLSYGAPSERRRYLNIVLSQSDINYFMMLTEYNRTLAQRNACLKWSVSDPKYLSVLTDTLIRNGAGMRVKRRKLIESLVPCAQRILSQLSQSKEALSLAYQPEGPPETACETVALEKTFRLAEKQEAAAQTTLCGPHRDDIGITLNGRDARRFASQGQHRSIALSLKLAAVDYLKKAGGAGCVLLLDDIFAELDEARCNRLMESVQSNDQVFAASPQPLRWPMPEEARVFRVEGGMIREEDARQPTQV